MKDYIKQAIRTESNSPANAERAAKVTRLLHGAIGLCTEVGEFQDAIKKHIYYNAPLDRVNLKEEVSDIMWYLAIICDELGTTFEEVQEVNIKKLRQRFPDRFTEYDAANRDLAEERKILEAVEEYNDDETKKS